VVQRELRVGARRAKTYAIRLAAAGAALGISAWVCLWATQAQAPVLLGKSLFTYLSVLAFGYCLLVGPFLTSDCLSEERREGTLGLLFLTELSSLDVVLGKWVAGSLTGLYGLLAILPTLGLPLLLGGVTPAEYGRTLLAVLNAILFSLTAGMLVSTLSREQGKAILASALVILGLSGLLPGLAVVASTGFFSRQLTGPVWVALASPAYTGVLATDANYRPNPARFWISLGIVAALSLSFMIATALLLPRVWRQSSEPPPSRSRWRLRLGYTAGWRATFRRRLERNPIHAVAARLRWPHWVFWGLVLLVAVNVFWLTYGYRQNVAAYQYHVNFSHALVFTNRVWLCVMACRFWLEARRTGALELILTTPMPVRTLIRGHGRALAWLFGGPVLAIALLHVLYVEESLRLTLQKTPGSAAFAQTYARSYATSAASSLVNFLTDVVAISYVGAWLSVATRRATLAILYTFALVILGPWVLGYFISSPTSILSTQWMTWLMSKPALRSLLGSSVFGFPLLRSTAWVGKNLLFTLWSRTQLRRHLRAAAAQTYHEDHRWFARLRRRVHWGRRPRFSEVNAQVAQLGS
jgi:ABC-type transport system involved in multi-copper enzyme maturation permease subunit